MVSAGVAVSLLTILAMVVASDAANPRRQASDDTAASEEHALRFPGWSGSTRPRNPVFPGYPGSRPPTRTPPPAAPASPSAQQSSTPPCATRAAPTLPGFPGIAGTVPSSPADCVTPLAGLMTCGTFLTGSAAETPTPGSECCAGLSTFLNSSSSAGDGDRTLRCLCPVILGDVNRMLPKPVDPVRMMYLPIACGVVLPPQAIYICFTGQPTPPVVSRIPESWENPSSGKRP